MTRRRCTSALACVAIVVLTVVIVVVWVQFSQDSFKGKQQYYRSTKNGTVPPGDSAATTDGVRTITPTKVKHKEYIQKTHLEDFGNSQVEFVKPLKISPLPLHDHDIIFDQLHNNNEKPTLRHHSGHFRHKSAEIWDPHPHYEIDAFGKKLLLELEFNNKFVAPNLHVVTHGEKVAQRAKHDPKISDCFYTGKIKDDPNSEVAVSLCNGMTGYIRTSEHSYYIEPAESFSDTTTGSILHRMKQIAHAPTDTNDIINNLGTQEWDSNENHTIIEDDFPSEIVQKTSPQHKIRKRDVYYFDDIDTEVEIDKVDMTNENITFDEIFRTTRNADYSRGYTKRSSEYFVKVLVVADKTMLKYHKRTEDLTRYILILMSHVALLYKEATIGNAISIAVVHIRILEHYDFSNSNSQDMLRKFCDWQQRNVLERRHDVALLLTRHTICRNSSANICTTLGVAEVASMCRSSGCAIVRDKGLSTSYTIAHELGHVLSMPHDEDKRCESRNNGKTNNIMSKMMKNDTKPFMWSPCSKYFVTEFLDSNRAKCLALPPSFNEISSNYTNMLPGDTFEVDRQCELEFGPGYKICPSKTSGEPPCGHLWCINSAGVCLSQWSPWAEGTKCGPNSWCYKRKCIQEDRRQFIPIDGGWGSWQPWEPCSRTCGGGITISRRFCDAPRPENGGSYCTGKSIQYASCNTEDCDTRSIDFRAIQCAEFNGITKNLPNLTDDVQWIPKYGLGSPEQPEDYCRLYCRPKNSLAYYHLKDKVVDGTKCGLTSFDICVNGYCIQGGCDNKLESTMVLDECAICGGDNSRCQEITGTYNRSSDQEGYNRVVRIPKGSSNLNIRQNNYYRNSKDENYLALVDGETGEYVLNGNYMLITQDTDIVFGSLIIKYSGSTGATEWITTPKNHKLSKDLILEVLSVGKLTPPDITYRYVISKDAAPRYGWRLYQKEWSKCSSICEGMQHRKPICIDLINGNEVHGRNCDNADIESETEKQQCNTHCELTWNIVTTGACSPHCGEGYRRVYYNCMKINKKKPGQNEIVNEKHCNVLVKPSETERCHTVCNSTRWDYSTWSECSKTCGGGIQRRSAKCIDNNYIPIDDSHCSNSKKIAEQVCNTERCPVWMMGEKSSCSVPCGGGYRNITYYCILDGMIRNNACDYNLRPSDRETCNEQPCGRWVPENFYHPCSVTCGKGVEERKFACKKFDSEEILDNEYCRDLPRPSDSRTCYRDCDKMPRDPRIHFNEISDNSISVYDARFRTFRWLPGDWSMCSHTCDGGTSMQNFHCMNELGEENPSMCDSNHKPRNVVRCGNNPCPKWKTGDWSPRCDSNCERHRQVRCMDDTMAIIEDYRCDAPKKPQDSTKCKPSECSQQNNQAPRRNYDTKEKDRKYRWSVGAWKQCSESCGRGFRKRHIECEDSINDYTVVEAFCSHLRKPKASKPCERYNCKYTWIEGHWSTCSRQCDQGTKRRNVTCHKVLHGGIVDPVPLPELYQNKIHHKNYCSVYAKPATVAKCLLSHCGDEYRWEAEPWQQCSKPCGRKGRQIRNLNCVSTRTNEKVHKNLCPSSLKPPRKRKCNQWRCLYHSCKEIKSAMRTKENKDYIISVQNRPVQIYCYKMDTQEPQEYISLHPDKLNYAEFYDRRLYDTQSCPYNGERRDNCQCDQIGPERVGITKFWKVRLNITSMEIIGDDFTFSKQIKGNRIPFGTAGDCYSSKVGCAQGRFSVDLTYTSFKLSRYVRWSTMGSNASYIPMHRTATMATAKCGGYCGSCTPDPNLGLKVEIT